MDYDRTYDPEIRAFPRDDRAFVDDVQAAIARSRVTVNNGQRLLEAVRVDLLRRYPSLRIEEQDSLASLDGNPRWYVYRDGKIA